MFREDSFLAQPKLTSLFENILKAHFKYMYIPLENNKYDVKDIVNVKFANTGGQSSPKFDFICDFKELKKEIVIVGLMEKLKAVSLYPVPFDKGFKELSGLIVYGRVDTFWYIKERKYSQHGNLYHQEIEENDKVKRRDYSHCNINNCMQVYSMSVNVATIVETLLGNNWRDISCNPIYKRIAKELEMIELQKKKEYDELVSNDIYNLIFRRVEESSNAR